MPARRARRRANGGFTVIELMTAIVIVTVLVMIAMPNFVHRIDKAKEAQLQTNMRTLQTMLETYRTDWQAYPLNLAELADAANSKGYNKELANPFSGQSGMVGNPNVWAIEYVNPGPPGFVGYRYVGPMQYELFGYGKTGSLLQRDGGPYKVTNG